MNIDEINMNLGIDIISKIIETAKKEFRLNMTGIHYYPYGDHLHQEMSGDHNLKFIVGKTNVYCPINKVYYSVYNAFDNFSKKYSQIIIFETDIVGLGYKLITYNMCPTIHHFKLKANILEAQRQYENHIKKMVTTKIIN
jgi:hypothetical protein